MQPQPPKNSGIVWQRALCICCGLVFTGISLILLLVPPLDQWGGIACRIMGLVTVLYGPYAVFVGCFAREARVQKMVSTIIRSI